MSLRTRVHGMRAELTGRRVERAARRQLSAELAAFATPAERAELDLIIGRHSHEETREVRAILNRQDYERQRTRRVLAGGNRG